MIDFVLTISGRDRAGIVASLAEVVKFHDANWKRSELAEISGTFAGVVVVEVADDRVDELLTALMILREQGVHVTAQQVDGPSIAPGDDEVQLRITGSDRPGILHEVSQALSGLGISITRMGTVTDLPAEGDQPGFDITARLAMPPSVSIDNLIDLVDELASRMNIELHVGEVGDDQ